MIPYFRRRILFNQLVNLANIGDTHSLFLYSSLLTITSQASSQSQGFMHPQNVGVLWGFTGTTDVEHILLLRSSNLEFGVIFVNAFQFTVLRTDARQKTRNIRAQNHKTYDGINWTSNPRRYKDGRFLAFLGCISRRPIPKKIKFCWPWKTGGRNMEQTWFTFNIEFNLVGSFVQTEVFLGPIAHRLEEGIIHW